jgi:hypothetical protein
VKYDELKWTGLDDFLKGKLRVSKQDVSDFIKQNQIQVKEVIKSGKSSPEEGIEQFGGGSTKHSKWVLPGGENYRELLLTAPELSTQAKFDPEKVEIRRDRRSVTQGSTSIYYDGKHLASYGDDPTLQSGGEYKQRPDFYWMGIAKDVFVGGDPRNSISSRAGGFRSSHFDEPNILAHVRFNDRMDAAGKKNLFIEEVQSDWHEKGRKEGYAKDTKGWTAESLSKPDAGFNHWQIKDASGNDVTKIVGGTKEDAIRKAAEGIPDAPFKTTWHELALKRMLRYAAENGYDRLSWTTGEQQNARYDLSKQISKITLEPSLSGGGKEYLAAYDLGGKRVLDKTVAREELPGIIGKDAAEKLLAQPEKQVQTGLGVSGKTVPQRELSGIDLKVGGSGMKGFYDKIIPDFLNKYAKKWGARVGTTNIATDPQAYKMGFKYDAEANAVQHPNSDRWAIKRPDGSLWGSFKDKAEAVSSFKEEFGGNDGSTPVHSIEITPAMKHSVMHEGQPIAKAESFKEERSA